MKRCLWLIGAWLLLAGCTGPPYAWHHPQGLGPADLERDRAFCQSLVREETWRTFPNDHTFGFYWGDWPYDHRYGYWGRGYLSYPAYSYSYTAWRRDLEDFCLKARGWRWGPTQPGRR